jgi:hypothetical protein
MRAPLRYVALVTTASFLMPRTSRARSCHFLVFRPSSGSSGISGERAGRVVFSHSLGQRRTEKCSACPLVTGQSMQACLGMLRIETAVVSTQKQPPGNKS